MRDRWLLVGVLIAAFVFALGDKVSITIPWPDDVPIPTPVDPVPFEGKGLLIVYDDFTGLDVGTRDAMDAAIDKADAKGVVARMYDKDVAGELEHEEPFIKQAFERKGSLPWFFISNGTEWEEGAFDLDSEEKAIALIEKYFG